MHLPLSCLIFQHAPRKHQANVISAHTGIPPDCFRLAEKLALVAFRLFLPRPLWFHVLLSVVCVASKVCQLGDCADRVAHARHASLQPVLLSSSLSMLSGEIYLRLKPYLVVKISPDIVTEHCCQVCILSTMFCRSDCRQCANMVSDCAIRETRRRTMWIDNSDRPTWDVTIFFTFDFHI